MMRNTSLLVLVSALLVAVLGLTSVAQAAELTVEGVTTGDRDNSDFVVFKNLQDTQYFHLRKSGRFNLSFIDNGVKTPYLSATPDFFGNEDIDVLYLGNNPDALGTGDTVIVGIFGPSAFTKTVFAPTGNTSPNSPLEGYEYIYSPEARGPDFDSFAADGMRSRARDLVNNFPPLKKSDTGMVVTHDGSGSAAAGRYEYLPNCPKTGVSGDCAILIRDNSEVIENPTS